MVKVVNLSKDLSKLQSVGYESGFLVENDKLKCNLIKQEGIEVLSIGQALSKYKSLKDYYWKLVNPKKDEFTESVEAGEQDGYFIRAKKGQKTSVPVQSCLFISKNGFKQKIHNIIIAEEGSTLDITTGCLTGSDITQAIHIGVTEIFVEKNATVNFTMVHNWDERVKVRPRTATLVKEGGRFVSNYVCINKVYNLQMAPKCTLEGINSSASLNSFIVVKPGSNFDLGAEILLNGEGCRAEIVSRIVSEGGEIINRGKMLGNAKDIKAHLECNGLMVVPKAKIVAIPELEANLADLTMTHEAAIGKVQPEAVEYLESRGMSEKEAISLIIRGFLNFDKVNLPVVVRKEIEKAELLV